MRAKATTPQPTATERPLTPEHPLTQCFYDSRLVRGLSEVEKAALWGLGLVKAYAKGQVIVDFDDDPTGTFTVLNGAVSIFHGPTTTQPADEATASHCFGESWSLLPMTSRVRVIAETDCSVHLLDRERLGRFFSGEGALGSSLRKRLTSNLVLHLVNQQTLRPTGVSS
jgi:hypothetical protein